MLLCVAISRFLWLLHFMMKYLENKHGNGRDIIQYEWRIIVNQLECQYLHANNISPDWIMKSQEIKLLEL